VNGGDFPGRQSGIGRHEADVLKIELNDTTVPTFGLPPASPACSSPTNRKKSCSMTSSQQRMRPSTVKAVPDRRRSVKEVRPFSIGFAAPATR
jgi:hypothetical protein